MKSCGIDLGTTNSCIYVVDGEERRVIADEYDHKIFPSVVYIGRDGKYSVGYTAKNRMGELPGPVTTIKRKMGTTEKVMLGGQERTPVDVSALILEFLKELAEKSTGEQIDRAVVTVPAYFNHIQRQQTDEAARKAGFREVVTLLEPVAAALAYSLDNEADRLRVFVYDLGGGTFDATVLEKDRFGGITVLSFGGDPFLGGDDIDARLVRVMIQRLEQNGYNLALDLDLAEDFSRFQKIKFFAEVAKKRLTDQTEVTLERQGFIEDKNGTTIDLDLTITREELEECSRDLIARSVEESLRTLAKKEIPIDSIDEIIMVGGMSRMPLAQRLLAEAFGRQPKVEDPDLIVARGAAIKAAEVFGDQEVASSGLRLELRYDRRTDKDRVRISGLFDQEVEGFTLYLFSDKAEFSETLDRTNRFTFDNIPLAHSSENVFTLSVEDRDENTIIEREIRIVHEAGARQLLASPGSVVTKPIHIWTVDELDTLFPENTALPHSVVRTFETSDQSGQIVAPIWEGDHEVARLEIRDIPRDLRIGTPVVIEVRVESDYQIYASASVPDIGREVQIRFRIEPVDTSMITPEYVRQQIALLDQEAQEAIEKCPSEEAVSLFRFHYGQVKSQIEVELAEMEPKRAKLIEKIAELSALIQKLPSRDSAAQMKPTYEEMSERLREIVERASANNHSKLGQTLPQINALQEQARRVWENRDPFAWKRINSQVDAIEYELRPEMPPAERAAGIAAWIVAAQVPEMRESAAGQHSAEIDDIEAEATLIYIQMDNGVIQPQEAINRLIKLYQGKVVALRKLLGLTSAESPVADPSALKKMEEGRVRKRQGA
ncbi:MAG TPA: Hsp70 family protein [Blastocatellia bacterium]|nr:Hsp70 family protein [Blastocatellia bacterium]